MPAACPDCKTINLDGNRFCRECGAPLEAAKVAQETAVDEQPAKGRTWPLIAVALVALCAVAAILGVLLAGPSGKEATPETVAGSGGTGEVWLTESPELAGAVAHTVPPPAGTPELTPVPPTPSAEPVGMHRSNPAPRTETVSAPGWEVRVLETLRGEPAWQEIRAANQFNEAAQEGMEYLLVKLYVQCRYDDNQEHVISQADFWVTGDRYERYFTAAAVEPEPQLNAPLYSGGETEGWVSFLVGRGEGNLVLIFDELMNLGQDHVLYIALDDGASLTVPPALAGIETTDLGRERESPAPLGETITTDDWQVFVLEVTRGAEARNMVSSANPLNDPPGEGMEYVVIHVYARYISTEDEYTNISGAWFQSTGGKNVLYELPIVAETSPAFDCTLYPGGECQGWVTLQAAQGETDLVAVFEPFLEFTDRNKRFLALEP